MSNKTTHDWTNLNQVSQDEHVHCGINDMNCIEGQKAEREALSITNMNPGKANAQCSITNMNCIADN